MAVYARIELEEQRLEITRAHHREIALVFNHDLTTIEISNLSLSLQVAYLGVIVRYRDSISGIRGRVDELLQSFRALSVGCNDILKLMRSTANGFQITKAEEQFVWNATKKDSVEQLRANFATCLAQAKSIYDDLGIVCPHPHAEIKKIYQKIAKITAKVKIDGYFSIQNYRNHIRVTRELGKVTQLQFAIATVTALGCFITGIEHIIKTIETFVSIFDDYNLKCPADNDLFSIHSMITLVVIATASAVYFESISIAITEMNVFNGNKYCCDKAEEVFRNLTTLFLKSIKKKNIKERSIHRDNMPCGMNENKTAVDSHQFNLESSDNESTDEEEEQDFVDEKFEIKECEDEHYDDEEARKKGGTIDEDSGIGRREKDEHYDDEEARKKGGTIDEDSGIGRREKDDRYDEEDEESKKDKSDKERITDDAQK